MSYHVSLSSQALKCLNSSSTGVCILPSDQKFGCHITHKDGFCYCRRFQPPQQRNDRGFGIRLEARCYGGDIHQEVRFQDKKFRQQDSVLRLSGLDQQGAMPFESLIREMTKVFGYGRAGDNVYMVMMSGINLGIDLSLIDKSDPERISLA